MSSSFVRVLGVALAASACAKPAAPPDTLPLPGNPPMPDAADATGAVIPEVTGADATGGVPGEKPGAPEAEPEVVLRNPPAPLPTWDDVESSHPKGATNPPSPVLIVSREPYACFKGWMGGMIPWPPAISQANGKVVTTPADAGTATQIACPDGQPQALIAAWDALPAEVRDATAPQRPRR